MRTKGRDAPRGTYRDAKWHEWWTCQACGAVVADWHTHTDWHDGHAGPHDQDAGPQDQAESMGELAARARAEGNAVAEFWRGGLGEAGALVAADWAALRRLVARRRPVLRAPLMVDCGTIRPMYEATPALPARAPPAVPYAPDPDRAARWASMAALIAYTTGRSA